jgi:hypothetical protein
MLLPQRQSPARFDIPNRGEGAENFSSSMDNHGYPSSDKVSQDFSVANPRTLSAFSVILI